MTTQMSNANLRQYYDAWCHSCNGYMQASRNDETGEIECITCLSTFVECGGQNVEAFLAPSTPSPDLMRPSTGDQDGNELIQQILNRVLGLGIQIRPQAQSTLLNVMQQAASDSGRPIGIVVRQSVSPEELGSISSLLASGNRRDIQTSRMQNGGNSPQPFGARAPLASVVNIMAGLGGLGQSRLGSGSGFSDRSFEDLLHHILMNESSHSGAPPASLSVIEELERHHISQDTDLQSLGECCSITQEAFEVGDVAVKLPCGHAYKEESIVQWLKMHETCPVCRIRLSSVSTPESPSTAP